MAFLNRRIGIDLGTVNVVVATPERGVILNEPSVVALSEDGQILAVGREAREMIGRTPESVSARRPLREGVIADYRLTEAMLRHFLTAALGPSRFVRPEVMISVPAGITSTERRAVIDAALRSGARAAYLIAEPVAAALGAEIPVGAPAGNLIVDIGGGTTEVALISLGGVVAYDSARVGGDRIDQAIVAYFRRTHSLLIGDQTAEEVKIKIGSALPIRNEKTFKTPGRDLIGGLPKSVTVSTNDIAIAISGELDRILGSIRSVLSEAPPELAADIMERGLVLSGGGSSLRAIDTLISERIGVPTHLTAEPLLCVAKGAAFALNHLSLYKRQLVGTTR